jgi:hypothetical protein
VSLTTMQKGLLDTAPKDVHGDIFKQTVNLDGVFVTKVTFGVGAKWSRDLKPHAGTESCFLPNVAYVLSGTIAIRMDDGSEQIFRAGEVMMLPPGHGGWTVGQQPCEFVEFSHGNCYYDDVARK